MSLAALTLALAATSASTIGSAAMAAASCSAVPLAWFTWQERGASERMEHGSESVSEGWKGREERSEEGKGGFTGQTRENRMCAVIHG